MKQQLYSHYDFIVIGDHLAALWGAIQLLEKGQKVLIVSMGAGRSRNFAPRFLIESLDLAKTDLVNRDLDPIQILTSDRRFRVFATTEALSEECEFVYGHKLNEIVNPDAELVKGLGYIYRGSETGETKNESLSSIVPIVNDMIYFRQPAGWLNEKLIQNIKKMGGHFLEEGSLERVFLEKKTFIGIQVEGSSSMITANRAWVASDWNVIQSLMSEALDVRSNPSGWLFEIKVKLSEDAIPLGMSSQMIWVQKNAPVIEIDHLGKGEFVLTTTLPYEDSSLDRLEQRKVAQRLFKVMSRIVPDLQYNLNKVYPDIRDPERAEHVDLVEQYPFRTLEQIPTSKLRYQVPGLGTKTSVQGMSIVYDEAYPQLGEWGAYQAVQQMIAEWTKASQKPEFQKNNAPV